MVALAKQIRTTTSSRFLRNFVASLVRPRQLQSRPGPVDIISTVVAMVMDMTKPTTAILLPIPLSWTTIMIQPQTPQRFSLPLLPRRSKTLFSPTFLLP